jgi:hypothetical protein
MMLWLLALSMHDGHQCEANALVLWYLAGGIVQVAVVHGVGIGSCAIREPVDGAVNVHSASGFALSPTHTKEYALQGTFAAVVNV